MEKMKEVGILRTAILAKCPILPYFYNKKKKNISISNNLIYTFFKTTKSTHTII